ncbi:MAG: leucine-rich repeat protein [Ruminococcus sp.]|nr:leucine-rich repeat protein [Ruminococcus sp.]
MVSASHILKKTAAKAVTCTENGNKEYWTCEHCGKYFLSDDTNPETAKAVELSETVIPASHKLTKVEAKAPTCTEDGNKEYWTCEHCGKYFLSDDANPETAKAVEQSEFIIPALNHKNAIIQNASEPTETAPGYSGDRYCPDCDKVVEKGYTYWNEGNLTWKLYEDGTLNISGTGAMKDYNDDDNPSPVYQNSNVKKVVIEKGVTSIGNYAFSGCLGLKSITIPDGITSIGDHAFDSCINLRSITLPDSITSIGMWAFYNCWNVSSIIIPDGVTSIEDFTFNSCISLTSITIPNSVTNIKSSAFHNCADLTSITIPDSVTSIGDSAFSDCNSLQTISLGCGSALKKSDFGDQADLVSYTNQHLLTKTEAKAKTCTEDGNKEYWTCEHCGKYFLSDDTNPETAKAVEQSEFIIPASHKLTKVEAKDATCTEDGNKAYWTCEHCGKYFLSDDSNPETATAVELSETVIPALKHKNATTRGVVEPNGTKPGYSGDRYCPDCDTVLEKGYTYWNEGNLTWKLDADGTLTISGTGTMKDYDYNNNPSPANQKKGSVKKVVIKDGVTSIGNFAFYNCTSLTSITIPDSVTSIELAAFNNCNNLTSITIPDSVTSIGDSAFELCNKLSSITLSNNITSIGNWAFHGCHLTSITIPDSVTSIGAMAFYSCSNLQTISLSCKSSLKKSDFGDKANLVSYTNQHLLTKTAAKAATCSESGNKEYWTCEHCGKYFLSDDSNPETAKAVEQSETILPAIQHKNAELRNSSEPTETSPGYSGDLYCPDCDTVVEKGYTYWIEDNLTWKLYEDGTLNISGTGAMKDYDNDPSPACRNSNVKKVVIEDGVTSIGNKAFDSCSSLTSITIPNSVTNIGAAAFDSCGSLTSITIPGSVTSIGTVAFYNCSGLTSVTIPDSVTNIGAAAFDSCGSLTSIVIPNSVTSIESYAFSACSSLTSITIPDSVTSIGNNAFDSCSSLTSITIPDSVTSIGNNAFDSCSSLTSITIPDGVASIESYAFYNCSGLTSITIPDSVTNIGAVAFDSCTSLTSITIPDSVTSIESYAFYNCSGLTSITIPDSVTNIGAAAFDSCTSLKTISLSCKSSLKRSDFGEQVNSVSYASHTLKKTEAKAATYAENGNKAYWTCEHCGKYFLSDDSNPETAKAVELSEITIPTIKHSYDKNGFCKNDDTHYQPATYNEESEKYEISNAGQLYWFAEQVNSGNASLNAVLTTDIVVNETVLAADGSLGADPDTLRMWRSIGNDDAENIFKGTFDGQGHTISGLYFSNDSNESNVMCASLFGVSAGIIQNVGLEDSYLNHYNISAGICAINNGQIVNCYNAGTILGYGASGICAINSDNGSIENCYNTGVIRGFGLVAGICNMNTGSMKDCYNNNSDITVMTDSTIIDENDEKSYASGICNNNGSSGRIENCYHVGQVSGADVNNNICNLNAGQIENSYYDCNICDKDAITQNESSAVMKNVESKTTKQFASGEVTYLLNGDQSAPAFYQNLATEKYPVLNPQSKAVVRLELIQDESFGEAATTKTTYHNTGDTVALETSPDKAYMYQYFVNEKKISGKTYTIKNNTEMTMKKVPVDIELSEIDTIQLTCQKKMTLDLTEYLKNFVDLKPVQFQLATGSKLPDGLKLTEDGILSGTPKKAATVKTTIVLTAENDSTKEMNLVFIVNAPVTTTTTTITTTTTTKATTTTKPSKTTTTKVTTTTKPNKTTTTKATTTTTTTISSYGDVNLDGMVDILDAVFLNKYLATLIQFSDAQMANADCCQDGVLNDQDTTALMQFIILLIDDLPAQPTEK